MESRLKEKYRIIYQPRGAAKEYADLAANLYSGCVHGCKYCYAPSCTFKDREIFHASYGVRDNVVNAIQKDLIDMSEAKDDRRVLLCFTSDPYQGGFDDNIPTKMTLELFKAYNKPIEVLTKGGMRAARDFHLYKKTDAFATTLTCDDETMSLSWEPKAAMPSERIASLRKAKEKGISTWVSFEPVVDPEQVYTLYEKTKGFVDLYKIGKMNHYKLDIEVDWHRFAHEMIDRCKRDGKAYYIKDALKKYV